MKTVKYRRLQWIVLAVAAAGIVGGELVQAWIGPSWWWVGPLLLLVGVGVFTPTVFARLELMDRTLHAQEQRAERLFASTAVGMVLVGRGCRIERMNPAAERLTGWQSAELAGKSVCSDLFAAAANGQPICFEQCLGATAQSCPEAMTTMTLQTKSGKQLAVAVCVTRLDEGEFSLVLWDMSERTRLERELARRRRQAESLYEVGRTMSAMVDLDRNLERLLDKAREVMEADLAGWASLDDQTQELHWQVVSGGGSEFARVPLPLRDTVAGRVLGAGRPFVTQNLQADVHSNPAAAALVAGEGLLAALAVPLQVRDRHYGVLFVGHRCRAHMSDEDLLLLSNLGSHLSIAVENSDLLGRMQHLAALEERQRLAREVHDSFGQILTMFGMRLHLMEGMVRAGDQAELLAEIAELRTILHDAHQDVRKSIYQLKESGPALAPLWERWTEHLRLFAHQTGIEAELSGREAVPAHLPERVESQLTRIIQEALVNVRNHSGARHVLVDAYREGSNLILAVRDDGCGFDGGMVAGPGEYHFGMSIMRERAESLGGRLEILSEPGHGTQVRITVPVLGGGGNDHVSAQSPAGR